jgi:hypothetical protein
MAAVYRTMDSCPTDCAFYGNGCYGTGRIFGIPRDYGTATADDPTYQAVRNMAGAVTHVRFNVVGDYLDADGLPDMAYIEATNHVARSLPAGRVIAYTHAWQRMRPEWFAYPVNASCDTPADIAAARAAGWQTVAGVPTADSIGQTVAGSRIVACPAQTRDASCASCMLCARVRPSTVGFVAHGTASTKARAAVRAMAPVLGSDGTIRMVPA